MIVFWLYVIFICYIFQMPKKGERLTKKALQATSFDCDLRYKILRMIENPSTLRSDYEALVPMCKRSDRWFAQTHPNFKVYFTSEDMVNMILSRMT